MLKLEAARLCAQIAVFGELCIDYANDGDFARFRQRMLSLSHPVIKKYVMTEPPRRETLDLLYIIHDMSKDPDIQYYDEFDAFIRLRRLDIFF